ncbi:MAG: winged helix DNA-binding domain-containing protein [Vicinamibacterales bacterium]
MPRDILSLRALNRATLARQHLLDRNDSFLEVTARLVGVQAQMPRPPLIGLWARVHGLTREAVVAALLDKRLVRGTAMRGTLHLMTDADFRELRGPLQAGLDRGLAAILRDRALGIEMAPLVADATEFFCQPQTFDAFRDHLAASAPAADIRAMAYAVRMQLPLLQVPTESAWGFPAQADFISADTWLGKPKRRTPARTTEDLVLRYLAACGPATAADAQAWLGLPSLKPVFEALRPRLVTFRGERGGELFDLPDAPRPDPDVPAPVRFLPDWDNAIVGRADARLLAGEHRSKVYQPGLRILATVLLDGQVAGTWKIERRKKAATLFISTFARLTSVARRAIEPEAAALLEFAEPDAAVKELNVEAHT